MQKNFIFRGLAYLIGALLVFIGLRFLISPEAGEAGYGIVFAEESNYSFHYIKGIRDLFAGLLFLLLAITRQFEALGIALLAGTVIPVLDSWIVLFYQQLPFNLSISHILAIVMCLVSGIGLLLARID